MRAVVRAVAIGLLLIAGLTGTAVAGFSGTDLYLPMAGRQAGVHPSNWYTKVWIYNPFLEPVTVRMYLLQRNTSNPSPPWVDVAVGVGETVAIDNAVETLFHVQVMGALRITSPVRVVVTSRVYSKAEGSDDDESVGQDFAAVPATFAIGSGEKTQVLGVYQTEPAGDSSMRFNYGFVETTGHSATVRITVHDATGAVLGTEDLQVLAWSQRQVAFKDHFPAISTENVRLEFEVVGGTGRVIPYGSAIANASQDPTTFEMSYAETLLSGGTITAVTAGQGLAGGGSTGAVTLDVGAGDGIQVSADTVGIADRGVIPAKIAPAASEGMVLMTIPSGIAVPPEDGLAVPSNTMVAWVFDGVHLPYYGAASSAVGTDVFTLVNTGAGRALHAVSGTDTAIWAQSAGGIAGVDARNTTGNGVSASSTSGTGVFASSTSGRGVWGRSTSGNAGVYGEHTGGGIGVSGSTTSASNAAVYGNNGGTGPAVKGNTSNGTGVYGITATTDLTRAAVVGENISSGQGILGKSSGGNGVWAYSNSNSAAALSATNEGGTGDLIDGWAGAFNKVFRVARSGDVYIDGTYHTGGADFAEMLPGNPGLEAGDVLAIGADGNLERSTEPFQASVAGVFSTRPGYLGGSPDGGIAPGTVPLAVVGIVPVKASAENGPIRAGDLLVASATPGHAMRAGTTPPVGTVIGKALTGVECGRGVVTALVFLH